MSRFPPKTLRLSPLISPRLEFLSYDWQIEAMLKVEALKAMSHKDYMQAGVFEGLGMCLGLFTIKGEIYIYIQYIQYGIFIYTHYSVLADTSSMEITYLGMIVTSEIRPVRRFLGR